MSKFVKIIKVRQKQMTKVDFHSKAISDLFDKALTPKLREVLYTHVDSTQFGMEASMLIHIARTALGRIKAQGGAAATELAKEMLATGYFGEDDEVIKEKGSELLQALMSVRNRIFEIEEGKTLPSMPQKKSHKNRTGTHG